LVALVTIRLRSLLGELISDMHVACSFSACYGENKQGIVNSKQMVKSFAEELP
jgi:hypothetical protein